MYGLLSQKYEWFPATQIRDASRVVRSLMTSVDDVLYQESDEKESLATVLMPDRMDDGLVLIMGVTRERVNMIRVIDRQGNVITELNPDWFEIWADSEGAFPDDDRRPKAQPGAMLHGIDILDDGDFILNFEHLSTMRMDFCGEVKWKLDNLGHHSVHMAEDGTVWVAAENYIGENPTNYKNHIAPLRSWTLQQLSQDGVVLDTIPIIDVLVKNGYEGLLTMSSLDNSFTQVSGDTLHLNDIDVFPSTIKSELFSPGDLMFSMRNINTIVVMDRQTHDFKFVSTGQVLRHHDPDFLEGNKISVFNNRNLMPDGGVASQYSEIVEIDVLTGEAEVVVGKGENQHFFTDIMGTHERLPNGNILISSSQEGRALETLDDGTPVWEYINVVERGRVGRLTMAKLLPGFMDRDFFDSKLASCS